MFSVELRTEFVSVTWIEIVAFQCVFHIGLCAIRNTSNELN